MLPPIGILKINMDGSVRGNLGPAGVGGVGKDSSRLIVFFLSEYRGQHSNNLMETLVILLALKRAYALSWKKVICKSKYQVVVDMINR